MGLSIGLPMASCSAKGLREREHKQAGVLRTEAVVFHNLISEVTLITSVICYQSHRPTPGQCGTQGCEYQ